MRKFYVFVSVRDDAKLVQDDRDNEKKNKELHIYSMWDHFQVTIKKKLLPVSPGVPFGLMGRIQQPLGSVSS